MKVVPALGTSKLGCEEGDGKNMGEAKKRMASTKAKWVSCLLCRHEDPGSDCQQLHTKPGTVACTCNPTPTPAL